MTDGDLSGDYIARAQSGDATQAQSDLDALIGGYQAPAAAPAPPAPITPVKTKTALGTAADVAKDIGYGAGIESEVQAVGGVADAIGNASKGLAHVGDWLDSHVANLSFDLPSSGNKTVDAIASVFADPLAAAGNLAGMVPPAKTFTGGVIREGAKFLSGFIPALRAARGIGLGPGLGSIAAGAAAGGAVLDPNSPNLSKTINDHVQVPAVLKPAVDALATNPDDPEIVNRARNVIENAGFGVATEAIFRGVKAVAAARRALSGEPLPPPKEGIDGQRAEYGDYTKEAAAPLGDPEKPAVSVSSKIDAAAKATDGRTAIPTDEGSQVFVNWARINEPDDVKNVMQKMANAFGGKAAGPVATHEETQALADSVGISADELLARNAGEPMTRAKTLAARNLWAASGEKLTELAQKAADPNASVYDKFNFRKMMATHVAIQNEVLNIRAEQARALNAWAIPSQGGVERARAIKQLLDQNGGEAVSTALAQRIAALKNAGVGPDGINAAVRKGWAATTVDGVREAYILGMLWSPQTHIVNAMSNSVVAAQQIGERYIAEQMASAGGVAPGEAAAMIAGLNGSIRDAFTYAARTARTGESGAVMGKAELPRESAISSAAVSREMGHNPAETAAFKQTGLGQAIDYLGFANGIPGRALGASDEFFKTIGYRMEVHAQAVRQAAEEGLTGKEAAQRYAELVANPPENVRIAAADAALYNTFQNEPGRVIKGLMQLRDGGGAADSYGGWLGTASALARIPGTVLLPFLKTPGNILSYTFERTPAAPLVARWRADVAAGGARGDLARARLSTGTMLMANALDLADSGLITGAGPTDPAQKEALMRTGWRPSSFRIGDKYVSYQRTDPVAMPLAFASTIAERMKSSELSPEDYDSMSEAAAAAVSVVAQTVTDKTWFKSIQQVIDAIQSAKEGPGGLQNYINQQTGNFVPFSSALRTAKRFEDPVTRQVMNPYDAIIANMPVLSRQLPAALDVWGKELKPDEVYGRAYDVLSPIGVSQAKQSPIDNELVRLRSGLSRIAVKSGFDGVRVDFRDFPNVYNKYVRLAGNDLPHPGFGQGAKDMLDAVVTGNSPMSGIYSRFSDEGKADFIKQRVSEFRQLAQAEIMLHPQTPEERAFVDYVHQKQQDQRSAKLPQ